MKQECARNENDCASQNDEGFLTHLLSVPSVFSPIMDYLDIQSMRSLSYASKAYKKYMYGTYYDWKQRIQKEFGVSKVDETLISGWIHYCIVYNAWITKQRNALMETLWFDEIIKLLNNCIKTGRVIYMYETWIVFLGLPVCCFVFTLLLTLRMNGTIALSYHWIYLVLYVYILLIIPFLCFPGIYIQANTNKRITREWFLSYFNSNFIFTTMKCDFVTRNAKKRESSVKYISNNEVVFQSNDHYYYLLGQVFVVYFGIYTNILLFHIYQTWVFYPWQVFLIMDWFFTVLYGIAMGRKMQCTGIKKDEDKWEYAYYFAFVFQFLLLSSHLLFGWPRLDWALLPLNIVIGSACCIISLLFFGFMKINMAGIYMKRFMSFISIVALVFLLLFFTHLIDHFSRGKPHSPILFGIDLLIPEICMSFPIVLYVWQTHKRRPAILKHDNYDIVHNRDYLHVLTETHFDLRSRLQQIVQTETKLLRYIICTQLFRSFIQTPSIIQNPQFPIVMELINSLRNEENPDITHAIHVLHNTHIEFNPLLQCIIEEVVSKNPYRGSPQVLHVFSRNNSDLEMNLLGEFDVPLPNGMSPEHIPELNPDIEILFANNRNSTNFQGNEVYDGLIENMLFSVLDEASFEETFS